MNKHYDQIICGATFHGVGAAIASGHRTLIIEKHALAGHDFIECLNPGTSWNTLPQSRRGKEFRDALRQRNLLSDEGGIHLPGVYPLLCQLISEAKLDVLFLTDIVKVESSRDGFKLTLFHASGYETISAATIIDTTANGLSLPPGDRPSPRSMSINAYIDSADRDAALPANLPSGMSWVQGRFPAEIILKLETGLSDTWPEARHQLHRRWAERPTDLQPWTLTSIAGGFEIRPASAASAKLPDGWSWRPSAAYDNLLLAYDHAFQTMHPQEAIS